MNSLIILCFFMVSVISWYVYVMLEAKKLRISTYLLVVSTILIWISICLLGFKVFNEFM